MRDYEIGALEALSWAYARSKKCRFLEDFQKFRNEIGEMLMALSSGAAVSFKTKIEFIPEI